MRAMLQRKCGCAGACGSCREKRELRRSAIDSREPESVPRSVERVLAGPGTSLDASLRQTFEPRFGHDFSAVRVHTDAEAAASSRDVHARAWTVGNHIAFGAGQSPRDLSLLAHELAHVVQQSNMPRASSLTIGAANDPAEREADAVASIVMSSRAGTMTRGGAAVVRRQARPRVAEQYWREDWEPMNFEELRRRHQARKHPLGRALTEKEITTIEKATGATRPKTPGGVPGAKLFFVLHDTAGHYDSAQIQNEAAKIGPQGLGVQAMASRTGLVDFKRPIWELRRPSATAYEQSNDILSPGKRGRLLRLVWAGVKKTEREAVLDSILDGFGFDKATKQSLRNGAITFLGKELSDEEAKKLADGSRTAATWTVESLCQRIAAESAAQLDLDPKKADPLAEHCAGLAKWFATRNERIESVAGVEIVQQKETKDFLNPDYTEQQYKDVADLYLRAALAALRWPTIETHWHIDQGIPRDPHTDPRCFRLGHLYELIAEKAGHQNNTIYGIEPSYGTDPTIHNVWWSKWTCHGGPPA